MPRISNIPRGSGFPPIRNLGLWHFRWDLASSLSARIDKAIVSPRARAGPVIRHSKGFLRSANEFPAAHKFSSRCIYSTASVKRFWDEVTASQELPRSHLSRKTDLSRPASTSVLLNCGRTLFCCACTGNDNAVNINPLVTAPRTRDCFC